MSYVAVAAVAAVDKLSYVPKYTGSCSVVRDLLTELSSILE
jgi:hypothetical protein